MKPEFNFEQSAVIPYRNGEDGFEVLLITSRKKQRWIVPKGYIDPNLSAAESAKKEAFEEAGVLGNEHCFQLGSINLQKSIGTCHISVFGMEVDAELETYPEMNERRRVWFEAERALALVHPEEIKPFIIKLFTLLQEKRR